MIKIVYYPDPVLLKPAEPITEITEEIRILGQEMISAMHNSRGVGLAGPQVGISKRIIVVCPEAEPGKEKVLLNPVILKKKGKELGEEGCLSFPGIYGNVQRATWIQAEAMLISGEKVIIECEGFPARVLQHEIDHLNGIVFVNKCQPAEQVSFRNSLKELEEKHVTT